MILLPDHLTLAVDKGGHGFERRNLYVAGGFFEQILIRGHHYDHANLQSTLRHKTHPPAIELEREKLLQQYWNGRRWTRQAEREFWQILGPQTTIGEPELSRALLEVARAFGSHQIAFRLGPNI